MARLVLLLPFNTIRAFADAVVCVYWHAVFISREHLELLSLMI
jgi:hypothetical protein